MEKILACIDGSDYAQTVCDGAAWASERTGATVTLLHVFPPHPKETPMDLSGAIGLGAKSALLEQLTGLDAAHGRAERRRGKLMLEQAEQRLRSAGLERIEHLHRRGTLADTIADIEDRVDLIVMGKRGEGTKAGSLDMGAELERVARDTHRPFLVTGREFRPVRRFLLAFDKGSGTARALDFVTRNSLLKGLECHVVMLGKLSGEVHATLTGVAKALEGAGIRAHTALKLGPRDHVIGAYVEEKEIDLVVTAAGGDSFIRRLLLRNIPTPVIRSCPRPFLLFR